MHPPPLTAAAPPPSTLPGPFPVGAYAAKLKERLQQLARVQLAGEVVGVRFSRVRVYFELRDPRGALPCSMWRTDLEALGLELRDGMRVVAGGGCDLYPGSASASPHFAFAVTELRIEGEGDLLVQLARLRRRLHAEGLTDRQAHLPRSPLPRTIGVVTAAGGKAGDDVRAALARRGWRGRLVWAFAAVQDRHAAPQIAAALQSLAACPEVDVVIVARGGGSLADLLAFCDEGLCRTVAMLRVPVISSVGHHTDRTVLDDVAAVACSTPTHAAEAAVPVDCAAARAELTVLAGRLRGHADRAVLGRARHLVALSRAPRDHLDRHRRRLAVLAAGLARATQPGATARASADLHARAERLERAAAVVTDRRRRDLDRLGVALAAHDPARTLERGYAVVEAPDGTILTGAAAAQAAPALTVRFHDGSVTARPEPPPTPPAGR